MEHVYTKMTCSESQHRRQNICNARMRAMALNAVLLIVVSCSSLVISMTVNPVNLRIDHMPVDFSAPPLIGMEAKNPTFSWDVETDVEHSGYVLPKVDGYHAHCWDADNNMTLIFQENKRNTTATSTTIVPLRDFSADTYYTCDVTIIMKEGGGGTAVGHFVTGTSDWKATWIQGNAIADNQCRDVFHLPGGNLKRASLFVSGIGYYIAFLNGQRVGNNELDSPWTTYQKRALYTGYDVTDLLRPESDNVVGLWMGSGWYEYEGYGPRTALLEIHAHYETDSGMKVVVLGATSKSWKCTAGPIIYDSIYNGETYNASMEAPGWNADPKFNDKLWTNAVENATTAKAIGVVSSQWMPTVQVTDFLEVRVITMPKPGVWVFDFGQNFAGWCRLKVKGTAGSRIQLRYAEILNHYDPGQEGMIYTANLRSAKATDVYYLRGDAQGETYEPHFTYHGFRYVELTGIQYTPTEETLTGVHVHSNVFQSGSIEFSIPLLNSIQRNIIWGQRSNLMSLPTDCDQRDERKGWMGDAALTAEEASMNFDMTAFYKNFLRLIMDEQGSDGTVTDTVPHTFGSRPADPSWGSAFPTISWAVLKASGDRNLVRDVYPSLQLYLMWMNQTATATSGGIGNLYVYYGDWVPPPPAKRTNGSFVSAFSFLHDLKLMTEIAAILEMGDSEVELWNSTFTMWSAKFHSAFYNPSTGVYCNGEQTAQALALWLGVVPASVEASVLNYLVTDVENTHDGHVTTGIIGVKFLYEVLMRYGYADLAVQMATKTDYPSYGYMITNAIEPATTLWELWDSPSEGPGMNSRSHIMFGSIGSWFYYSLAGVRQEYGTAGFESVVIRPAVTSASDLKSVSASLRTPSGEVSLSWERPPSQFTCQEVAENSNLEISCSSLYTSNVVAGIAFASFGTPVGECPTLDSPNSNLTINPSCHSTESMSMVQKTCLNTASCSIPATNDFFQGDPCYGTPKLLGVTYRCTYQPLFTFNISIPLGSVQTVRVEMLLAGNSTSSTGTSRSARLRDNKHHDLPTAEKNAKPAVANSYVLRESLQGRFLWSSKGFIPGADGISNVELVQDATPYMAVTIVGAGDYSLDLSQGRIQVSEDTQRCLSIIDEDITNCSTAVRVAISGWLGVVPNTKWIRVGNQNGFCCTVGLAT